MKIKALNKNPIGIIRRLDALGRVCLPKEYCKHIGIKHDCTLEILLLDDDTMLIKKYISNDEEK